MGKFDNILLCTDLDGTLRDSKGNIPKGNIEAINYFMENGGRFTLATGRNHHYMRDILKDGLYINAPLICLNGAMVYDIDEDKVLWERPINRNDIPGFEDFINENKDLFHILSIHLDGSINTSAEEAALVYRENAGKKLYKLVFVSENAEDSKELRKAFIRRYSDICHISNSWPEGFEILDKNATKGHCIENVKKLIGNGIKTVAVGDYENDLTMLRAADLSFAVGNALPEAANAANIVTSSNDEEPFEFIIEEIEKRLI